MFSGAAVVDRMTVWRVLRLAGFGKRRSAGYARGRLKMVIYREIRGMQDWTRDLERSVVVYSGIQSQSREVEERKVGADGGSKLDEPELAAAVTLVIGALI